MNFITYLKRWRTTRDMAEVRKWRYREGPTLIRYPVDFTKLLEEDL